MERGQRFLTRIFGREDDTAFSRRDALAGLGLGALLVATAKFVAPSAAQGKPLDKAAEAAVSPAPETEVADNQPEQHTADLNAADTSDATDLSSRRHWRRRRWWRRRWRRRYWRRRYYWRRPWRRRYWRRRYWRRRYWW
jgi:hypothetical protein